jgi:hypothetical protein
MDSSTEINLHELSDHEIAAPDDDLKEQLRIYFRHIVGLAGAYEHVHNGEIREPKKPFYYSAVVIEVRRASPSRKGTTTQK